MELRHLRYFVAVAEELSFSRAAAKLRLAQPSLSAQIRRLEEELGLVLLDRSRRHVALTKAGVVFLQDAKDLLARADAAVKRARDAADERTGEMRVATVGSLTLAFLPASLTRFRSAFPDVKLAVSEMSTADQVTKLTKGQIHLGFIAAPFPNQAGSQRLTSELLIRSPIMVVMNPSHSLAARNHVALGDLAEETFIHIRIQRSEGHRFWTESICRQAGFPPRFGPIAESPENLLGMVAAGEGIALIPMLNERPSSAGYVFRPLREQNVTFELYAVWNPALHSALLASFLEIVRTEATHVQRSLRSGRGRK